MPLRNVHIAACVAVLLASGGARAAGAAEPLPGGVAVEDLTGDGLLDILTTSPDGSLRLLRSAGDGTFEDASREAGLAGVPGGAAFVPGDVDGDGLLDVLVLRGRDGAGILLRQGPAGTFRAGTAEAGLDLSAPSRTAFFADVENDGDLDLVVGHDAEKGPGARLWRNRGDGTFEDVTEASGVATAGPVVGAAFADIDRDGAPDFYLSVAGGANALYRNDGHGMFRDVAEEWGAAGPDESRAIAFVDLENDWDPDLFVGSAKAGAARLYRNDGKGAYHDVTDAYGLGELGTAVSASVGDVDGDTFPDLILGGPDGEEPAAVLHNHKGLRLEDGAEAFRLGALRAGAGVAFGDVDNDGDPDLVARVAGHAPDDAEDMILRTADRPHRWTRIELEGTKSNRFGVGATVRIRTVNRRHQERFVIRRVGVGSSLGGDSVRQEIALGDAERILWVWVHWPGGEVQRIFQPEANCAILVREGEQRPVYDDAGPLVPAAAP